MQRSKKNQISQALDQKKSNRFLRNLTTFKKKIVVKNKKDRQRNKTISRNKIRNQNPAHPKTAHP